MDAGAGILLAIIAASIVGFLLSVLLAVYVIRWGMAPIQRTLDHRLGILQLAIDRLTEQLSRS
jgi:hypothetical protein